MTVSAPVPTWTEIGQAFIIGVYTFCVTFLAGLIGHGLNVQHWSNFTLAVESAIAAALAFLGWTGYHAAKEARKQEVKDEASHAGTVGGSTGTGS